MLQSTGCAAIMSAPVCGHADDPSWRMGQVSRTFINPSAAGQALLERCEKCKKSEISHSAKSRAMRTLCGILDSRRLAPAPEEIGIDGFTDPRVSRVSEATRVWPLRKENALELSSGARRQAVRRIMSLMAANIDYCLPRRHGSRERGPEPRLDAIRSTCFMLHCLR
jgi:hypothetical protein